jgi:putative tryptophan/tyrosine transport system substrate-binding protein
MRRRDFIKMAGCTAAIWSCPARGQSSPVLGLLASVSRSPLQRQLGALHEVLSKAGYAEGQTLRTDFLFADGHYERLPSLAADLVRRKVDVILTAGDPAALAAKRATSDIPIVFLIGGDPVKVGLAASLARPGGNSTGLTMFTSLLEQKRVGLLREALPSARVMAVLHNPDFPGAEERLAQIVAAAPLAGLKLVVASADRESALEPAFENFAHQHVDVLLVAADPFFTSRRALIVALAARHKLPTMYQWEDFVVDGGLMSYGTSLTDAYREVGGYIARILRGTTPSDLPVLQPTKFTLGINLKTAKALGLAFPPTVLASADTVIE